MKTPYWLKPFEHPLGGRWWKSGPTQLVTHLSTDDGKLHMSVSHPDRYPTWDEIITIWRWLAGTEVEGVIVLPRGQDYVNFHNNCFHVWESACGREAR